MVLRDFDCAEFLGLERARKMSMIGPRSSIAMPAFNGVWNSRQLTNPQNISLKNKKLWI
jgi:hypothetical protein